MNLIIGHAHMDMDSLGSLALAQLIFPGYQAAKSRICHPVALNVYNIYKDHLRFLPYNKIKGIPVDHMIIVDTRNYYRVKEIFKALLLPPQNIDIYDHHSNEISDIKGAQLHENYCGANSSALTLILKKKGTRPSPEIATIALSAIFSDTGSFSHSNVTQEDFEASSYLIQCGANIALVQRFLKPPSNNELEVILHRASTLSKNHLILGHYVSLFYLELPKQISGLSTVVDRLFTINSADALIGCFGFNSNRQILLVGRSSKLSIDVSKLLSLYGGGGHILSASATIKKRIGDDITSELIASIRNFIEPELSASDMMDSTIKFISEEWNLYSASMFLEEEKMSGAPVVDADGYFVGTLTLHNISLARKNSHMDLPVKGYMESNSISCNPSMSAHEVENIFFSQAIGRLPVLGSNRKILGVITRERYLDFLQTNGSTYK